MNLGWGGSGGGDDYQHPATHPDTMITVTDINGNFVGVRLDQVLDELFQSVSNGKTDIEAAIIDKFGTVSKAGQVATFSELVTGVLNIPIGPYEFATGIGTTSGSTAYNFEYENGNVSTRAGLVVSGLSFKPTHIFVNLLNTDNITDDRFITTVWLSEWESSDGYTLAAFRDSSTTRLSFRITNKSTGAGAGDAYSVYGGFCLPIFSAGRQARWLAFGPTPI